MEQENQTLVNNVKKLIASNSQLNDAIGEMIVSIKHLGQDAPKARESIEQAMPPKVPEEANVEADSVNQTNGANSIQNDVPSVEGDMASNENMEENGSTKKLPNQGGDFGVIIFSEPDLTKLQKIVNDNCIRFANCSSKISSFNLEERGNIQHLFPRGELY